MASEAPLNFQDAFNALFASQTLAATQAETEAEAEAIKAAANMLPETIQRQRNDYYSSEFEARSQLQLEAEENFKSIVKFLYADHAVLSCPHDYLSRVKELFAEEESARLTFSATLSEAKQAIQGRLDAMEMQGVVLCDGSPLSIRKSVLVQIPLMYNLMHSKDAMLTTKLY